MKRTRRVPGATRLTREEEQTIERASEVLGEPVPDLVRNGIFGYIRRRLDEHVAAAAAPEEENRDHQV